MPVDDWRQRENEGRSFGSTNVLSKERPCVIILVSQGSRRVQPTEYQNRENRDSQLWWLAVVVAWNLVAIGYTVLFR